MTTMDTDTAEELVYSGNGTVVDGIERVDDQHMGDGRWSSRHWCIVRVEGELMGFHYEEPLTECQEGMDMFDQVPVPLFLVRAVPVQTVEYVAVK